MTEATNQGRDALTDKQQRVVQCCDSWLRAVGLPPFHEWNRVASRPPEARPAPKLYAWQPSGHGEHSLIVVAESEALAFAAVESFIAAHSKPSDFVWVDGWGTDYYRLTVLDPGEVLIHAND